MTALWSNLVDTLAQPVEAFRRMREEPMVLWGIVVALVSQYGFALGEEPGRLPASPAGVIAGLLTFGIAYFLIASVIHLVARALGGRGSLSAVMTAFGFASLPLVLNAPVFLLSQLLGTDVLFWLGMSAFSIWSLALDVLALREVYEVSTGKAVGILVLGAVAPVVALVVIAVVVGVFFAALLA